MKQANPEMQTASAIPSDFETRNIKVLVVDDSKAQRRIVALNLRKWGFDVREAGNGLEALDICRDTPIDLVLSDWMMPGMNGLEFCRAFRELSTDSYGYFILLTSKNEKNDVARGYDVGADDFLTKPFNSAELKARIRAGTRVLTMQQKLVEQNRVAAVAYNQLKLVHAEVNKDLAEAGKLQHSLVPVRHQKFDYGEVSLLFKSSQHVGGDFVGFFNFTDSHLTLFSLDVSGHGVSSALLTARLAGYLSPNSKAQNIAFVRTPDGQYSMREPREIAHILNTRMMEELETEHYFTMVFADIDLTTGRVKMCQAGHPHPAVFNPATGVRFVGEGGPPIGLVPNMTYENFCFDLVPGDRFFLYSDGVTECQNMEEKFLDDDGFKKILKKHISGSGPEFMDDLIWELTSFANGKPFGDDVSGIMFEFTGFKRHRSIPPQTQRHEMPVS